MSKVVDITGVSSKEARLKRIIASLEEIKDTLVDVIDAYEAEDESSDKLDLLTEPPAVEVVVDEMIAILSDREQLIKEKESEHAQAVISEIYREGL